MNRVLNSEEENSLIDCIIGGESPKFELLVQSYERKVFGTMLTILGNRQDAEDVTQETFLTAFRKLSQFQRRSSFYTWLYRIAYNLAIDLQRRRGRTAKQVVSSAAALNSFETHLYDPPDRHDSPSDIAIAQETVEQVRRGLGRLDSERRSIIVMRDIDGMDYSEIAAVLDLPIGTVRSRLHRARLELRDILNSVGCGPTAPESLSELPSKTRSISNDGSKR
jgi:RNA polymerase sigma-70 factor (ECF subfamily)